MTILYEVSGTFDKSSCYGTLSGILSNRNQSDFNGINLYMKDPERKYGYEGIILDQMGDEYVRSMMRIARAVGFGAYIPRTLGQLKEANKIHFPPEVPFYIVVAVTGFFRAWAGNHEHLKETYDILVSKGLDSYTAFCGAQTLTPGGGDRWVYYPTGEHSVVPWCICNERGVAGFKTWKDRACDLMPMSSELASTGTLSPTGRDRWFGACMSGNENDPYEYGHHECETLNHIVGREGRGMSTDDYETSYINIDSLVEEVKTWTT